MRIGDTHAKAKIRTRTPKTFMKYFYQAKTFDGKAQSGTLEAQDKQALAKMLHEQGLVLMTALEEQTEQRAGSPWSGFGFFGRVSLTDKLMFTRNLQVMITAGVPLPKALVTLAEQARSTKFNRALKDIADQIGQGRNLAEAIGRYPNIFSRLFQQMIKVGGESGTI